MTLALLQGICISLYHSQRYCRWVEFERHNGTALKNFTLRTTCVETLNGVGHDLLKNKTSDQPRPMGLAKEAEMVKLDN